MAVNDAVDKSLKLLRKQLKEAQHHLTIIIYLGGLVADKNKDLQDALDGTQNTVDSIQAQITEERRIKKEAADAQQTLIDDLKAQLATGPSGLTEEQVNAAIQRLAEINVDLLTTPEAQSGETPVPIG